MTTLKIILLSLVLFSTAFIVKAQEKPQKTLLFFTAKWCQYCIIAKNDINNHEQLSEIIKNYEIIELDFNKDKDIIDGHNVKSLPTFIIYQDGKELSRHVGYRGPKDLIKFLK